MKIIISETQLKKIIKEEIADMDDFLSMYLRMEFEVFQDIKNKKKIVFNLINPNSYKKALNEYVTYGKIVRFPEKYILDWKETVLENIGLSNVLTEIHGHTSHFPFDTFYDVFDDTDVPEDKKYDFYYAYDILEKYDIDNYVPFFSNGQPVLSDYGLEPLNKLANKLIPDWDVNSILVTINKIMDVAHQRSDLSELFLEGGQASHYMVSNT